MPTSSQLVVVVVVVVAVYYYPVFSGCRQVNVLSLSSLTVVSLLASKWSPSAAPENKNFSFVLRLAMRAIDRGSPAA